MTQFFRRYRNLFLANEATKQKSPPYPIPLKDEFKKRLQSLKVKHNISSQNNKLSPSNRFQKQILPQLNSLNKKSQKYKLNAESSNIGFISLPPPIYYTPEVNNKYKKYQHNSPKTNMPTPRTKLKRSELFRQRFYRLSTDNNNHQRPLLTISNPQEQKIQMKSLTQLQSPKLIKQPQIIHQKHYQTSPIQQPPILNQPQKLKREQNRKDYNYPQINYGLVFSEYENQNQFKMVDSRIRDIKWIQKFHPRGYINSYRQALLRRRQNKERLVERKNRLKRLYADEEKEYSKKKSII